jgi:hypothetical protein
MPVSPNRRGARPSTPAAAASGDTHAEREAMFELALEAGNRTLDAQRDELSGIRTRVGAYAAIVLSATAFLVGTGLGSKANRNESFYATAISGTVFMAIMLVLVLLATLPLLTFKFILLPDVLVNWIEGETPVPSRAIMVKTLAGTTLPEMIATNERSLKIIRWFYRGLLASGFITVGIWVYFTWAVA